MWQAFLVEVYGLKRRFLMKPQGGSESGHYLKSERDDTYYHLQYPLKSNPLKLGLKLLANPRKLKVFDSSLMFRSCKESA